MDPKNRDLLIRAAGMLEGAAWVTEQNIPVEFFIEVSDLIYKALGINIDKPNNTREE